jgi:hypothetical protein
MGHVLAFEAAVLSEVRYTRYTVTHVDAQGFATWVTRYIAVTCRYISIACPPVVLAEEHY